MRALPEVPPPVLLLDAGGTIVFLDGEAVAGVLAGAGIGVEAEAVLRAERLAKRAYEARMQQRTSHQDAWAELLADILVRAGVEPGRAAAMVPALRAEHERFNLWRRVGDGVGDALDRAAAAGARLGLVSNSEGKVRELIERVGLDHRFEVIVDSGIEGVSKPDPEIFRRALRRMGVSASDAVYAGDIPRVDIAGARAAGMRAVLVDPGGDHVGYQEALRFSSVAELVDALYARGP